MWMYVSFVSCGFSLRAIVNFSAPLSTQQVHQLAQKFAARHTRQRFGRVLHRCFQCVRAWSSMKGHCWFVAHVSMAGMCSQDVKESFAQRLHVGRRADNVQPTVHSLSHHDRPSGQHPISVFHTGQWRLLVDTSITSLARLTTDHPKQQINTNNAINLVCDFRTW